MKLLVFDLDGTLLTSDNKVTEASVEAIWNCKQKGYKIAYITGRGTIKTKKFIERLPVDAYACNNGSIIYCEDKLVSRNTIAYKEGSVLLEKISNNPLFVVIEPLKYLNYDSFKIDNKYYFRTNITDLPNNPIDMISVKITEKIDLTKYPELTSKKTKTNKVMISHKDANKAQALQRIANYFKIAKEDITAFGDDYSDIDVFMRVGQGVAMQNAIPELKQIATAITKSNNEEGIASFIIQNL